VPAEHIVNGENAEVEIQIMHQLDFRQNAEMPFVITSYLFKGEKGGESNDLIDQILGVSGRDAVLDVAKAFPNKTKFRGYY